MIRQTHELHKIGAQSTISAEPLVGYTEAAGHLGIAVGTLYSWVSTRRICFYRIGPRCIRFKISELQTWLADRAVEPSARVLP